MPFKKVNIKEKVENKIKCDSEFAKAYERVSVEYNLIFGKVQNMLNEDRRNKANE